MRKFLFHHLFAVSLLIIGFEPLKAQYDFVELERFSNRIDSPVEVTVEEQNNSLIFYAINRSFFSYDFKIRFSQFENLSPRISEKQILLKRGTNRLFTLKIMDNTKTVQYKYSVEYLIGNQNNKTDLSYPYLLPVGNNKNVNLFGLNENGKMMYKLNHFMMNPEDTVYCIRRGIITALPDNRVEVDRIANSSLEILHEDGTIAVYRGIIPNSINLNLGQTVYPGQPIGIVGGPPILILNVCSFQGNGIVQDLKVYYSDNNGQLISSELILNKCFAYPISIIKKEMTNREIKKYESMNLF